MISRPKKLTVSPSWRKTHQICQIETDLHVFKIAHEMFVWSRGPPHHPCDARGSSPPRPQERDCRGNGADLKKFHLFVFLGERSGNVPVYSWKPTWMGGALGWEGGSGCEEKTCHVCVQACDELQNMMVPVSSAMEGRTSPLQLLEQSCSASPGRVRRLGVPLRAITHSSSYRDVARCPNIFRRDRLEVSRAPVLPGTRRRELLPATFCIPHWS